MCFLGHFKPVLKLLDLHSYSRAHVYEMLFSEMKDIFLESSGSVSAIDNNIFSDLLKMAALPVTKEFALQVMTRIPDNNTLSELCIKMAMDSPVFPMLPTNIKRLAWKLDSQGYELLKSDVIKVVEEFSDVNNGGDNERILLDPSEACRSQFKKFSGSFTLTLANFIGNDIVVYNKVLNIVRSLYLKEKRPIIVTLRHELLMKLHEIDNLSVISMDPCYKLAWCLNAACMHPSYEISERQAKELKSMFDVFSQSFSSNDPVTGEIALILAHPHVQGLLAQSILLKLEEQSQRSKISKDSSIFWMYQLLHLSFSAYTMLASQSFIFTFQSTDFLVDLKLLLKKDSLSESLSHLPSVIENAGEIPCNLFVSRLSNLSEFSLMDTFASCWGTVPSLSLTYPRICVKQSRIIARNRRI